MGRSVVRVLPTRMCGRLSRTGLSGQKWSGVKLHELLGRDTGLERSWPRLQSVDVDPFDLGMDGMKGYRKLEAGMMSQARPWGDLHDTLCFTRNIRPSQSLLPLGSLLPRYVNKTDSQGIRSCLFGEIERRHRKRHIMGESDGFDSTREFT